MYEPKVSDREKITNLLDVMSAMKYVGERLAILSQMSDDQQMSSCNEMLKGLVRHLMADCVDAMPEQDFPHAISRQAIAELDDNVNQFSTLITKEIVDRIAKAEVPQIVRNH
jgi:hypothetical protein